MLRVDRHTKKLKRLDQRSVPEAGFKERYDIQQMICNSPDAFFAEMGETLLLIGQEVRPADFVEDRIDLISIDQHGAVVVIELKRGTDKLQLLQALTYATMVSKWDRERLIAERVKLAAKSTEEASEEVEQFLLEDIAELNQSQRVVLVAEDYDYEVLATAEWLTENYSMDIRCYRLALSADNESEFLTCTCIYPPPEITQHATRRGRLRGVQPVEYADWEDALKGVDQAIVEFFRQELSGRQAEAYLRDRALYYRHHGKRRWTVAARPNRAYVWQTGHFNDDEAFWINQIGSHIELKLVNSGHDVRFYLASAQDFAHFLDAIHNKLTGVEFIVANETPSAGSNT